SITDNFLNIHSLFISAKHHQTIAEIFEKDLVDVEQAIRHYEQAADYYKGEESNSSAMKCQLLVAKLAAQLGQYDKAATLFEEVCLKCMTVLYDTNLLLLLSLSGYFTDTSSKLNWTPVRYTNNN
ncbi:unnamed protein product, partial [Trichobilharzia regenti]